MGGVSRLAAGLVVGASLGGALAATAQVSHHDGAFWGRLGNQDRAAYVAGYSDASDRMLSKLSDLRVADGVFHWKGANKVLAQVARGLDLSGLSAADLIAYLDRVYANPRYGDFDVGSAIEVAAMRGIGPQSPATEVPVVAPASEVLPLAPAGEAPAVMPASSNLKR
jgi:hypothetical protein